jgi:hypothetical protein
MFALANKTPRTQGWLSPIQGEGIVQPESKDSDQLSRHLHQPDTLGRSGQGCFHMGMAAKRKRDIRQGKVRTLSAVRAGYLAGLIDGEGTIALSRKTRGGNRQLFVSISSTERPMLEHVLHIVGVGKITNKRTYRKHHTPSCTYIVANRQALKLLEQIQPYLQSYKRRRARLVLNDYLRLTPRNGKYSATQLKQRERFVKRFLELRANNAE